MSKQFLNGLNACDVMTIGTARDLPKYEEELNEARVRKAGYEQIISSHEGPSTDELERAQMALTALNARLPRLEQKVKFAYGCAEYVQTAPHLKQYRALPLE